MPAFLLPALGAGAAIGLILGLIGAGGSIIAVPLLVYGVGVPDAHAAIGTAAVAVSLSMRRLTALPYSAISAR